jgi:hypothetical protein
MVTASPKDVIEQARQLLSDMHSPAASELEISDEFLQKGQWLHLIVTPKREGVSALDFVDTVEEVEAKLREIVGEEVLIVPAKP